jgi:hypothetical protein
MNPVHLGAAAMILLLTNGGAAWTILHSPLFAFLVTAGAVNGWGFYLRFRERARAAAALELERAQSWASRSEARLEALQAQLQPHFIFNSLHTISTPSPCRTPGAPTTWRRSVVSGLIAPVLAVSVACGDHGAGSVAGPTPLISCPAGEWASDSGGTRPWGHDCSPLPGPHFTVYSDGSSADAKATLLAIAEASLAEVAVVFAAPTDAELGIVGGHTLHAFSEWTVTPVVFEASPNGFLAPAIDRQPQPGPYQRNPDSYWRSVKHELTHVVALALARCHGKTELGYPDVWFREGQAVYVSGSHALPGLTEFRRFAADPARVNPVSFHLWRELPQPNWTATYYPLFGLLYAYLVDAEHGYGATAEDVRNLLRCMANGEMFATAFERAFRLSLADLEANYYQLMEGYLTRTGVPWFPTGAGREGHGEPSRSAVERHRFGRPTRLPVQGSRAVEVTAAWMDASSEKQARARRCPLLAHRHAVAIVTRRRARGSLRPRTCRDDHPASLLANARFACDIPTNGAMVHVPKVRAHADDHQHLIFVNRLSPPSVVGDARRSHSAPWITRIRRLEGNLTP